ncbi:unnamed protein product, partial [Effrenium voratum]
ANGPGSTDITRDNFIPLFDGKPSSYKEYRKRIMLYYLKMGISSKKKEATINLLTSLSGPAWRQVEHMVDAVTEKDDGFQDVIHQLDKAFQYDDRVEMPRTFEKFFYHLQRRPEMNLLAYCTEHREHLREIEKHKISIPPTISGWLLLRRANLTAEQRQMVLTHTSGELSLERVEASLYYLFGQDYTSRPSHRPTTSPPWDAGRMKFRSSYKWSNYRKPAVAHYQDDCYLEEDPEQPHLAWTPEDDYPEADIPEDDEIFWEAEEDYPADTEATTDEPHPEEEEEVYAAYMDARRKLAEVRSARGYYPVVALGPSGSMNAAESIPRAKEASIMANLPRRDQPSPVASLPPSPIAAFVVDKKALGSQLPFELIVTEQASQRCRCYMVAILHESTDGNDDEAYIQDSTDGMITGLQDGGASSVICGHDTMMNIVTDMVRKNVNPREFKFSRTHKTIRFGGDGNSIASWCIHLPVFMAGYKGRLQVFLVEGRTPLLVGRPILEALKLKVDYEQQTCSILGEPWQPATRGSMGEYLIRLDEGIEDALEQDLAFDYMTDDVVTDLDNHDIELYGIHDYLKDSAPLLRCLHHELNNDGTTEPVQMPLPYKMWKTFDVALATWDNCQDRHVDEALRTKPTTTYVFWEIYSGRSNLSKAMEELGWEVRAFDLPEWDFARAADRQALLRLIDEEMPDIIWLAPPRKKWSRMQQINQRNEHQAECLAIDREMEHRTNLKLTRQAFLKQHHAGRQAYVEHPLLSLAWSTPSLHDLPAEIHQCAYGAGFWMNDHEWAYIKKPTAILSTEAEFAEHFNLKCPGDHRHIQLQGNLPHLGSLTGAAAAYQPDMCNALANLIADLTYVHPEHAFHEDDQPAADQEQLVQPEAEAPQHKGILERIHDSCPVEAQRLIARLHRNLGHPSQKDLQKILEARGASQHVLNALKNYHCELCSRYAPPAQSPKSAICTAERFNQRLQADTL